MKYFYLLLIAYFLAPQTQAQKTGSVYLPPLNTQTPEWFKVFYSPGFPDGINIQTLDRDADLYKKSTGKLSAKTDPDDLTGGEASEDAYIRYYTRWRRSIASRISANGTIRPETFSPVQKRIRSSANNTARISSSTGTAWSLVGPKTMRPLEQDNPNQPVVSSQTNIYTCAFAPSNTDIVYAGPESGGIYKSTDKGLHWNCVSNDYPFAEFYSLAVDPANPDLVYAGRNNAVAWSNNGGLTWNDVVVPYGVINQLLIQPGNTTHLFAAAENGLVESFNSGQSWSLAAGITDFVYDLQFKPFNNNVLYALVRTGNFIEFRISTDNGQSFTPSLNGWTGKGINESGGARLTVTPANSNRIYAVLLGTNPSPEIPFIFKSFDGGMTWDTTCTGSTDFTGNYNLPLGMSNGQGYYDLAILANPNNADEVLVGTTSLYKSTDGGSTFVATGGYAGSIPIHPDIQWMVSDGTDTWVATDGGMNLSSDFFSDPVNFSSRTDGDFGTELWGFTQGWNEDIVAGGRYHNGNVVVNENYPDGTGIYVHGGEAATGYYMYGRERHIAFSDVGAMVVPDSIDGPISWFSYTKYPNEDYYGYDVSNLVFWPSCYMRLYTGQDQQLWRSDDGGQLWSTVHDFAPERVKKFDFCRTHPANIYLATDVNLYHSTDTGNTWTQLTLPPAASIGLLRLAVSATDSNTLWISSPYNGSGQRIFKSVDAGQNWTNETSAIMDQEKVLALSAQAGTDDGIYSMQEHGRCFYKNKNMPDWVEYDDSLPAHIFTMYSSPFYRDSKLRIGTNKGVWQVPFFEASAPLAQPTANTLYTSCVKDTVYFNDFSVLDHDQATWSWTFSPPANYVSDAHVPNPVVLFGSVGIKTATLTVTNSNGSDSQSMILEIGNDCSVDTVPGNCLSIDPSGGWSQQYSGLNIQTNTFTISCWIKPDTIENDWTGIIMNSGPNTKSGLNFNYQNRIGYHWAESPQSYNWWDGPTAPVNEWSHVALVVTPDSATVYLNGVAYSNVQSQPVASMVDQPFTIGADLSAGVRNYRGQIDEVCFYNRPLSQQEIRELMNLTRNNPNPGSMPQTDTSLIAYYQFNELVANQVVDHAGINPLSVVISANVNSVSTIPVGGGRAETHTINSAGLVDYSAPGVQLYFPSGANLPQGDVVVTRLNVAPDQLAYSATPSASQWPYYVIRNYGQNTTFDPLDSCVFMNQQHVSSALAGDPSQIRMYRRSANAEGNTWSTAIDSATQITSGPGYDDFHFANGHSLTEAGQISFGFDSAFAVSVKEDLTLQENGIHCYPNPAHSGWIMFRLDDAQLSDEMHIRCVNSSGQLLKDLYLHDALPGKEYHFYLNEAGVYVLSFIFRDGKTIQKKLVVMD
ncbi:MAG TPA: hypothetical protein PKK99_02135 [Bacteroidia bacterium]|nr:hypothetical protein [Bacteroidia bacterium]